jgi:hypothetical protein
MEVLHKDQRAPPRVEKLDDKRLGHLCLAGLIEDVRADDQRRLEGLGIANAPSELDRRTCLGKRFLGVVAREQDRGSMVARCALHVVGGAGLTCRDELVGDRETLVPPPGDQRVEHLVPT